MESFNEQVVLVNEKDIEVGLMPKLEAHVEGLLHRAFSVFIFNTKGDLLLQQRASSKYHSPGLWSNTCCSHPRPGELVFDAAVRRLKEEMGLVCHLKHAFHFIYKAEMGNSLTEHEFDHVFFGTTDSLPEINMEEVQNWKYISLEVLKNEIVLNPGDYTEWLKIVLDKVIWFRKYGNIG